MEDDKLFKEIAEICKPKSYGTYQGFSYTRTEVKLLCIEAMMYCLEKYGKEQIDVNEFFKLKGLS